MCFIAAVALFDASYLKFVFIGLSLSLTNNGIDTSSCILSLRKLIWSPIKNEMVCFFENVWVQKSTFVNFFVLSTSFGFMKILDCC